MNPKTTKKIEKRLSDVEIVTSEVVLWSFLFIMVVGNLLVSIALIPILLVVNTWAVDLTIVLMALVLGALFNLIIRDIEFLEKKHHLLFGLTLPAVAIINIILILHIVSFIGTNLGIEITRENPLMIIVLYAVFFLIPYIYTEIKQRKK